MAYFELVQTRLDGPVSYTLAVTDLALCQMAGNARIFSITGAQGGLLSRNPDTAMAITASNANHSLGATERSSAAAMELVQIDGREALLRFGTGVSLQANWITANGEVGAAFALPVAPSGTILALKSVALSDGATIIFNSTLQNPGITAWLRSADGRVSFIQQLLPQGVLAGYDTVDMQVVNRPEARYLLTLSAQNNSLSVFAIGANTRSVLADMIGADDGLWVAGPSKLATAQIEGHDYVLLAASGSSSITVLDLGANGRLRVIDQIQDNLTTRFQGVSVLEAITINGQVFVVAAGADDGLSLFALLPNGRLLHLESIADSMDTTLQNVSAISLRATSTGGKAGLDVFVSSLSEAGLTRFHVDLGTLIGPRIATDQGGAMSGGNDIVIDGPGADQLYGGSGADLFVFYPDRLRDDIRDFEIGIDRLDLSALGRFYTQDAIQFIAMAGGVLLEVAGEYIGLYSANGQAITADMFTDADLFGLVHTQPIVQPDAPREVFGTNKSEMFVGRGGNDTLLGGGGDDRLDGGGGDDGLLGGWGHDQLLGGNGNDTVWAGAGNDTGFGGPGADVLYGEWGNDQLWGNDGNDVLIGGNGNDWLLGNDGDDLFWGNRGNDRLQGGLGRDTVWGGNGNDTGFGGEGDDELRGEWGNDQLWGNDGNDVVIGNDGNDWLLGNDGDDRLSGNFGNDRLQGGLGRDTVWGGKGNDTLWGGEGDDALRGEWGNDQIWGEMGTDFLSGGDGDDWLLGNQGDDRLEGDLGNDTLQGGDGNDLLLGSFGDDILLGGRGFDRLVGGPGRNQLTGGEAADVFVFNAAAGGIHRVMDFQSEDRIELQGFGYGSYAAVQAHLSQEGATVVFADRGLEITFEAMTLAQFLPDDFGF